MKKALLACIALGPILLGPASAAVADGLTTRFQAEVGEELARAAGLGASAGSPEALRGRPGGRFSSNPRDAGNVIRFQDEPADIDGEQSAVATGEALLSPSFEDSAIAFGGADRLEIDLEAEAAAEPLATPVPGAFLLMAGGLLGLGAAMRRRPVR
jgi:hypothetical protein